jgi:hypothetical protein
MRAFGTLAAIMDFTRQVPRFSGREDPVSTAAIDAWAVLLPIMAARTGLFVVQRRNEAIT